MLSGLNKIRCIHCLRLIISEEITRDHIFPKSWYPDDTPDTLERWTAPACRDCNERLGKMEEDIFIRLAMCVDHREISSCGISEKALRALGIGANLSAKEQRTRAAKLKGIINELKLLPSHIEPMPGFGPPEGYGQNMLPGIKIPIYLDNVLEKIIRGLEYRLSGGCYIERDYELRTYIVYENSVPDVDVLIDRGIIAHHGPGFKVARNTAAEDTRTVLYRVEIWNKLVVHASILPCVRSDGMGSVN